MAVVETRNLTKVFKEGELGAVNDVNLETREGEFLVFLGPSGSGKTTLLRMIAGLEHPTAGEILIGGRVVNGLSPRERRIAMVFQSYALYPHLTVFNNIAFPLKAQETSDSSARDWVMSLAASAIVVLGFKIVTGETLSFKFLAPFALLSGLVRILVSILVAAISKKRQETRKKQKEKVEWAASLLGIGGLLKRKPRELSGGERQRVALARAIVREPSVFLLDEPLSNLDAKLRASARTELESFHRRIGTTTIYVTHDQVEAMAMGDRVVVLHQGYVRQIGSPKEVYDQPADTFVATFLGSPPMNLVENEDVIVGFRPEQFRPAAQVSEAEKVAFRFRVENVEYLGSEWIVSGFISGGRMDGKKAVARLGSAQSLEIGQFYDFAVAERELKFFDRATEKRVASRVLSWQ
ncbi:MAG TPA: ABC transporter ATP-binding protein [Candidatus Angelobacter sp.]